MEGGVSLHHLEAKRLRQAARGLRKGLEAVQARRRRSPRRQSEENADAQGIRSARQDRELFRSKRDRALAYLRHAASSAIRLERDRLEEEMTRARQALRKRAERVAEAIAAKAEEALCAVHKRLDDARLAAAEKSREQVHRKQMEIESAEELYVENHYKWTQLRRSLVKRRREEARLKELNAERAREDMERQNMEIEERAMRRLVLAAKVTRNAICIGSRHAWAKRSLALEKELDAVAERELLFGAKVERFGEKGRRANVVIVDLTNDRSIGRFDLRIAKLIASAPEMRVCAFFHCHESHCELPIRSVSLRIDAVVFVHFAWPAHTFSSSSIRQRAWWPALESFLHDMKTAHIPLLCVGFGDGFEDAREALLRSQPLRSLEYEQETYSDIWDVHRSDLPLVHPMVFAYFGHGTFYRWLDEFKSAFSTSHVGNWRITFSGERLRGLKQVQKYLSALSSTSIADAVDPSIVEAQNHGITAGFACVVGTEDQSRVAARDGPKLRKMLEAGRFTVRDALLRALRNGLAERDRRRRAAHAAQPLALFRRSVREQLFQDSPEKLMPMCFRQLLTGRTATSELLRAHIMRDFAVISKQLWHENVQKKGAQISTKERLDVHEPSSSASSVLGSWKSDVDLYAFDVGITSRDNVLLAARDIPFGAIVRGWEDVDVNRPSGPTITEEGERRGQVYLGDFAFQQVQRMMVARESISITKASPPPLPGTQREDGGKRGVRIRSCRNRIVTGRIETLRGALAAVGKYAKRGRGICFSLDTRCISVANGGSALLQMLMNAVLSADVQKWCTRIVVVADSLEDVAALRKNAIGVGAHSWEFFYRTKDLPSTSLEALSADQISSVADGVVVPAAAFRRALSFKDFQGREDCAAVLSSGLQLWLDVETRGVQDLAAEFQGVMSAEYEALIRCFVNGIVSFHPQHVLTARSQVMRGLDNRILTQEEGALVCSGSAGPKTGKGASRAQMRGSRRTKHSYRPAPPTSRRNHRGLALAGSAFRGHGRRLKNADLQGTIETERPETAVFTFYASLNETLTT